MWNGTSFLRDEVEKKGSCSRLRDNEKSSAEQTGFVEKGGKKKGWANRKNKKALSRDNMKGIEQTRGRGRAERR